MAANVEIIQGARIIKNGGEITKDRYINDSSNDLTAGSICYLSAGTMVPLRSGAGVLSTGASPFDAAKQYFVVRETVDVSEDAATYVAVQEINADTVLEAYVVDSSESGDVEMAVADIGAKHPLYMSATGLVGVDNVDNTAPIVVIEDVMDNYEPYQMGGDFEKDSSGVRHDRVQFKILGALLV